MTVQTCEAQTLPSSTSTNCEHYHVPDYLVGIGFRAGMSVLSTTDSAGLHLADRYYRAIVSRPCCDDVLRQLSTWAHAVYSSANSKFLLYAARRPVFSRDEALAISTIAAAQHYGRNTTASILSTLLENVAGEAVIDETMRFADALRQENLILSIRNVFPIQESPSCFGVARSQHLR